MNIHETVNFLKVVAPFYKIPEEDLEQIAKTMVPEQFSLNEFVIKQGVHGLNFYIIMNGIAKVYSLNDEGKEDIVTFLGEGDCFGEISLLANKPSTANVQAVENMTCLIQSKEHFFLMAKQYPWMLDFFSQLATRRLKITCAGLLSGDDWGATPVESYIYTKQIKDMVSPVNKFVNEKETISNVAKALIEKKAGSQVVTDDRANPKGIISVSTILESILLQHVDPGEPVEKIVEREFSSIRSDSHFFDALHCMIKNKTNTLVVTEGDKTVGVLTGFDLLRFRGREVLSLLRNIDNAPDLSQLNAMRHEIEKVLRELIADGASASQTCKIISEFNDRIVAKVIEFAEGECGRPPCAYAWLGLGSEGRKEQTLFTDQDNAIIIQRCDTAEYFKEFSNAVVNGLSMCGIPLCKNGTMASNPKFFGDLVEWKDRVAHWILSRDLSEKEMMDTYIFLDFRSLHGEQSLEKELKDHIMRLITKNQSFLRSIAEAVVAIPMPVGFFKNLIVEKSGEHKDGLNLKLYGLVPLVTCAKILAFHYQVLETNTLERIRALRRLNAISSDQVEFLEQALETFLALKIRNSLADCNEGKTFGNYIKPSELSTRQKQLLKEAFWAVSEFQKTTGNILQVERREIGFMR
jgi:CBS domain-containing protein